MGNKFNHSSVAGLDVGGSVFSALTSTLVDLGADELELASDVSSVAIENWSVSVLDLTWVVKNDDLGNEHFGVLSGVVLGVRADVASLDVLD